jgi:3-oxoacyl-[acyl-carrier-protein] synthase-1
MRRVVVTGMGIVSSIGNSAQEVLASLREAKSGIVKADTYAELGFRCQVHGAPKLDWEGMIDRKIRRFMGAGAAWNYLAMEQAIRDAGLEESDVSNERTGLIMGSGGPSTKAIVQAADTTREKGPKKVGPFEVPKSMSSTNSATLSTPYHIKGLSYSISSACSTSAHCIGNGGELIQWGKQDIVFAGGGEELDWTLSVLFDAMNAMSSDFNDRPEVASRAYDVARDGFVIAGGAGVVILEELEHARRRGARIYAEMVGYGATGDAYHMTQPAPQGEGAQRSMARALKDAGAAPSDVQYINAHGTSTPYNDLNETLAIKAVFGESAKTLLVSSTKSATGHTLGAAGGIEMVISSLAVRDAVAPPTINYTTPDPECDLNYVPNAPVHREIDLALSNSFGFGGHNVTLAVRKFRE